MCESSLSRHGSFDQIRGLIIIVKFHSLCLSTGQVITLSLGVINNIIAFRLTFSAEPGKC